jgi:cobalt-zinc-cadmium efflux system outer membrane protein
MVAYQGQELNNPEGPAGFQNLMISQEFVTAGKLHLAQTAAGHGVTVADWQAVTKRFELITRVRLAYFEMLTAQRELETNEQIVKLSQELLDSAKAVERAGAGGRPDVLRAEVELNQSQIRLAVAKQRAEAAWKLLALSVGLPKLPPTPLAGSLDDAAPSYDWCAAASAALIRSSEVQAAQATILQREWRVQREVVEPIPNVQVQAGPMYSFPDRRLEAQVQVGVNLPVFNKNQGNILSAQAQLTSAQQDARNVEIRLLERLTQANQRYQASRQQVETYQKDIVPRAAESLRLVQIGYKAGDAKFDYTTVVQAQQILIQSRLAAIQAQGELWKAIADIAGVVQLESLSHLPPTPPFPARGEEVSPPGGPPPAAK